MPIAFDIIPYPVRDDKNDTVAVSQQQATTIDGNFAKINTDLAPPANSVLWSSRQVGDKSGGFVVGGPFALGALWPAFNITVPARCSALIVSASVGMQPPTAQTFGLFVVLTGAGINSTAHEPIIYMQSAYYESAGATSILPASRVNPGKIITVTPSWYSTYAGEVGEIDHGQIYITAMR